MEVYDSARSRPVMIEGALYKLLIVMTPGALPYKLPYWYCASKPTRVVPCLVPSPMSLFRLVGVSRKCLSPAR